jgi:hypothetical protein
VVWSVFLTIMPVRIPGSGLKNCSILNSLLPRYLELGSCRSKAAKNAYFPRFSETRACCLRRRNQTVRGTTAVRKQASATYADVSDSKNIKPDFLQRKAVNGGSGVKSLRLCLEYTLLGGTVGGLTFAATSPTVFPCHQRLGWSSVRPVIA